MTVKAGNTNMGGHLEKANELEDCYTGAKPYLPTSPTRVVEVKVYIESHLNAWIAKIEQLKAMSGGRIPLDRQYVDIVDTCNKAQQQVAKIRVLLERVRSEFS